MATANTRPDADVQALPGLRVAVFLATPVSPVHRVGMRGRVSTGEHLVRLLHDSLTRFYADARFVILTTPETELPALPVSMKIVARPMATGPLMYERLCAYVAFLEDASDAHTYLFLDSDMLMLRPLQIDLHEDWDLALTYKSKGMLINGGFILIRAQRRRQALAFLRRALQLCEERHVERAEWACDQAALRDALQIATPPAAARIDATADARVLLLPRNEIAPVASKGLSGLFRVPNAPILHFIGARKIAMPYFHWLHIGRGASIGRVLRRSLVMYRRAPPVVVGPRP